MVIILGVDIRDDDDKKFSQVVPFRLITLIIRDQRYPSQNLIKSSGAPCPPSHPAPLRAEPNPSSATAPSSKSSTSTTVSAEPFELSSPTLVNCPPSSRPPLRLDPSMALLI